MKSHSVAALATRDRILRAATKVFAQTGFDGARVDAIAAEADINKERLYYYFGDKDGLFTAVLERGYRDLREAEAQLQLDDLPASAAILQLVEFTWAYYQKHPEFIRLLNSANQLEARHLKPLKTTKEINASHLSLMQRLVERGRKEGTVREGIDPVQLSINIAALTYFYLMNRHTLSIVFEREFESKRELKQRLHVMREVIARWIAPE